MSSEAGSAATIGAAVVGVTAGVEVVAAGALVGAGAVR